MSKLKFNRGETDKDYDIQGPFFNFQKQTLAAGQRSRKLGSKPPFAAVDTKVR